MTEREHHEVFRDGKVHVLAEKCSCGCGSETPIAPRSRSSRGWVRGQPMPRIPGHRTPAPVRNGTGCLIWQGRVDKNGYGRRGAGWAHRIAWEKAVGPIPPRYEVHHLCRTPRCVEPTHLECIPAEEHWALTNPRRATCGRGHSDWYVRPDTGKRGCRVCRNGWAA